MDDAVEAPHLPDHFRDGIVETGAQRPYLEKRARTFSTKNVPCWKIDQFNSGVGGDESAAWSEGARQAMAKLAIRPGTGWAAIVASQKKRPTVEATDTWPADWETWAS